MAMDLGPVQLIVFGFEQPKFGGGVAAELNRLKERDIVRVIDALVVHKNANGDVRTLQVSDLQPEQAEGFGAIVGGLIGMGVGADKGVSSQQGFQAGAEAGVQAIREQQGHIFDPEQWDVMEDIPNDTAAALVLLEHRWAIPFRDAVLAEGGEAIGDVWLHPTDLVAAGLLASEVLESSARARPESST